MLQKPQLSGRKIVAAHWKSQEKKNNGRHEIEGKNLNNAQQDEGKETTWIENYRVMSWYKNQFVKEDFSLVSALAFEFKMQEEKVKHHFTAFLQNFTS